MNRRACIHLFAAAALFAPAVLADEELPKADTVLDRYVEVTGGKAAYEKRTNEVAVLELEFVGRGIKGTMTRYADISNNSYSSGEIEGIGKIEEGVFNGQAWENSPMMGPRLKTGDENAAAVRDSNFNAALNWRKLYRAETAGLEKINGEDCYKVVMTPVASGKPQTTYYSRKTGYLVRLIRTVNTPMGEISVEQNVSDYAPLGGGTIGPKKVVQSVMGQEIAVTVLSVKVNEELPPSRFEPPAEIKKLMSKQSEPAKPAEPAKEKQ